MTVRWFVDRPTLESCWALARAQRRQGSRGLEVSSLEPWPGGVRGRWLRGWSRLLGLQITDARFFLGHLRDAEGENLFRSVRRASARVAWAAMTEVVATTPGLAAVNTDLGRDTVRLNLIKRAWPATEQAMRVVGVAQALARADGAQAMVICEDPRYIPVTALAGGDARVVAWGRWRAWVYAKLAALHLWSQTRPSRSVTADTPRATGKAVLVIQEDDLGTARDERCQPHWVDAGDPVPVVVWPAAGSVPPAPEVAAQLAAHGVTVLSPADLTRASRAQSAEARALVATARRAGRLALTAPTVTSLAWTGVGKLSLRAAMAAELCIRHRIGAFLSGESYLLDAAAVQLVAPRLQIRTVSYQYSNISFLSPAMMNTADLMLLFSPAYAPHWRHEGIGAQSTATLGYPYDGVADAVRPRARALREALMAHGAHFVIAYFDESVQDSRWGVVHRSEHLHDIEQLATAVLDDSTLGVIVKTQFARNTPERMSAASPVLREARATGRFVELCRGRHRNVVFPAEAALAADLTIGHAIGGTAIVESAVVGARSVIVNPYAWWGTWDAWYEDAGLVLPSVAAVLAALRSLRAGEPAAQRLGDWTPVLDRFVGIRDGRAPARLRRVVKGALAGMSVQELAQVAEAHA